MSKRTDPIALLDTQPIFRAVGPLMRWYNENARDLPWRNTKDPYHIWISEIMLQQTRVEAVIPYYHRFLAELPTIDALAAVSEERLLKLWEGLGYYSRAKNLRLAAQMCMKNYGGSLPATYDELLLLPGFGMYTAAAVASIAFGQPVPAVDGNVLRVVSRLCAYSDDVSLPPVKKMFFTALSGIIPEEAGTFNQALMDLGASVCIPNGAPRCKACPLVSICEAHLEDSETAYPLKPAKKPRRIEERTVFLIEYEGEYLLNKRSSVGLLASMWEFPNADEYLDEEQAKSELLRIGLPVSDIHTSIRAKHVFTHVEWQMRSYAVRVRMKTTPTGYMWVKAEDLRENFALPSAFATFKKEIGL